MGCAQATSALKDIADFSKEYQVGPLIDTGSYGKVWQAKHRETRQVRAVKVVETNSSQAQQAAWEEERIWRRIGPHENIVELIAVFSSVRNFVMVMEKCEESLMDCLPNFILNDSEALRSTFQQMVRGLAQVHRCRVVHRDVKPNNFLFGGPGGATIKLCDFGLSAVEPSGGALLPGVVGTTCYMSPEMVAGTGHDRSTDIWSLGVTAYLMVFGDFPYTARSRSKTDVKCAIMQGFPAPSFGSQLDEAHKPSASTAQFVRAMLHREPAHRRPVEELMKMPYLSPQEKRKSPNAFISNASTCSGDDVATMPSSQSTVFGGGRTRSSSITNSMSTQGTLRNNSFVSSL